MKKADEKQIRDYEENMFKIDRWVKGCMGHEVGFDATAILIDTETEKFLHVKWADLHKFEKPEGRWVEIVW